MEQIRGYYRPSPLLKKIELYSFSEPVDIEYKYMDKHFTSYEAVRLWMDLSYGNHQGCSGTISPPCYRHPRSLLRSGLHRYFLLVRRLDRGAHGSHA